MTLEEDEGAYDQMEPEFHEYHDHKDDDADLQEVEDLLETYFTHIDSTFAELEALDEFIDDTEDFVNIELDSQRNQLIKLELVLTTATLFVSMYGVVASIFGMNLKNGSEDSHAVFVLVNAVCAAGTILALPPPCSTSGSSGSCEGAESGARTTRRTRPSDDRRDGCEI